MKYRRRYYKGFEVGGEIGEAVRLVCNMVTDIRLSVRRVKLGDLPTFYRLYFVDFHERWKRRGQIQLSRLHVSTEKWSIMRALTIRLIHILFARLNAVARTWRISSLFESWWDPIFLEIITEGKLIGCCSLVRQSLGVFKIELFGIAETERGKRSEVEAMVAIKKYVKGMGATRIIVSTSSEEMAILFKKCGFRLAFVDDVLYFDMYE